jgi:hypothetical protein
MTDRSGGHRSARSEAQEDREEAVLGQPGLIIDGMGKKVPRVAKRLLARSGVYPRT